MTRSAARSITSLQNDRVKLIRSLDMRKARKETGLFVAEGAALLLSADTAGWEPEILVLQAGGATQGAPQRLVEKALNAGREVLEVSEAVLMKLAAKENPQSMLGVFRQRLTEPPAPAVVSADATWLVLEEVRDPGNLGTIIRTLDAVGGAGIVLVGTCCDPWSHECVRATMGSIFAVPLARMSREDFLHWRTNWPGDVVGTHLSGHDDFRSVAYRPPALIVMGSEGPGLSDELARACTRLVKIPMAGQLDSLNLAVATALMLYQVRGDKLKI